MLEFLQDLWLSMRERKKFWRAPLNRDLVPDNRSEIDLPVLLRRGSALGGKGTGIAESEKDLEG